jgi:hypothetical protein
LSAGSGVAIAHARLASVGAGAELELATRAKLALVGAAAELTPPLVS